MEIKKAIRKAIPFIGLLYGKSSGGKTYSALRLAKGMVDNGKICVIDTENGRASHYADYFDFDILELSPPFSPSRYIDAIKSAVLAGYKVIIVDSISHEWEGIGGVLEMAEGKTGLQSWAKPKAEHRKLMNMLLRLHVHVIFCARAKDDLEQVEVIKDGKKKTEIVNKGLIPIQEKNFPYEMLVTFRLEEQGKAFLEKATGILALKEQFKDGELISEAHGKIIADWINKGEEIDIEAKRLREEARQIAMEGEVALKAWFEGLEKEDKEIAEKFPIEFKKELGKIATDHDNSSTTPININEITKKI